MTLDEARMVLFVLDDVDNGCSSCCEQAWLVQPGDRYH